jgi:hypothetical protein
LPQPRRDFAQWYCRRFSPVSEYVPV